MGFVRSSGRSGSETGDRKEKHLSICLDPKRYSIEGTSAGFEALSFLHNGLPEIAEDGLRIMTGIFWDLAENCPTSK